MLNREQIFEYQRLEQTYGIWTAIKYAIVVTSPNYRNRASRTAPRVNKQSNQLLETFQVGDLVSTETHSETVVNGWHKVSGSRFVTGVIKKIKGDSVWIDCDGEIVVTLLDQCWWSDL